MLRSFFLLAALIAPATAALASPERQGVHEEDGQRYLYSTRMLKHGLIEIDGRVAGSGQSFRYIVDRQGIVSGKYDGTWVSFAVGKPARERLAASLDEAPELADASPVAAGIATVARGQ